MINESTTLEEVKRHLAEQTQRSGDGGFCPCCNRRVRDDKKGLNKWMALALADLCKYFDDNPNEFRVHAATVLAGTPGARNHGVALLRWWGLIREEEKPEGTSACGSMGLSGWYSVTPLGRQFRNGEIKVQKTILRKFGQTEYFPAGKKLISFVDALQSKLLQRDDNMVLDGTTV